MNETTGCAVCGNNPCTCPVSTQTQVPGSPTPEAPIMPETPSTPETPAPTPTQSL